MEYVKDGATLEKRFEDSDLFALVAKMREFHSAHADFLKR